MPQRMVAQARYLIMAAGSLPRISVVGAHDISVHARPRVVAGWLPETPPHRQQFNVREFGPHGKGLVAG